MNPEYNSILGEYPELLIEEIWGCRVFQRVFQVGVTWFCFLLFRNPKSMKSSSVLKVINGFIVRTVILENYMRVKLHRSLDPRSNKERLLKEKSFRNAKE